MTEFGKSFDQNIYGEEGKEEFLDEIPQEEEEVTILGKKKRQQDAFKLPSEAEEDRLKGVHLDPLKGAGDKSIAANESSYNAQRKKRRLSPTRNDPFSKQTEGVSRTYRDILLESKQDGPKEEQKRSNVEVKKVEALRLSKESEGTELSKKPDWENSEAPWGSTPKREAPATPRTRRWNMTPSEGSKRGFEGSMRSKTKWDETPQNLSAYGNTPSARNIFNLPTPTPDIQQNTPLQMTPSAYNSNRVDKEMQLRNRKMTDEEIDALMPKRGFEIVQPPPDYKPKTEEKPVESDIPLTPSGQVPTMKPEDMNYFSAILTDVDESKLSPEELRDRRIMTLIFKVKNGTPPMRKSALRQLTEKAREFGAAPLFNQILPLFLSASLEPQERHLLVKIIDRVLYKLQELVRPYVHKILVAVEPLLNEKDYYEREEGKEIISNLAKAAGLPTMITTIKPDIEHQDEYVRNVTARTVAVIASALGIPSLLPFLKAVCSSKKSWIARHTGIKSVQRIAILTGVSVLPCLKNLVEIVESGLKDEQAKVKTMTALALAALAEACCPYGFEAFESVIKPLFDGIKTYKGKILAAFIKCVGFLLPLMEGELAAQYAQLLALALRKVFNNADEEMRRIVLKALQQCLSTEGLEVGYIRENILEDFFTCFWTRRSASDKRNARQLVETTVELAGRVGGAQALEKLCLLLKDENEQFVSLVVEAIEKIATYLGLADVSLKLEDQIMDGFIFAFQEQCEDTNAVLNGLSAFANALGLRFKPYIPTLVANVKWRLRERSAKKRQQAAELVAKTAELMHMCGEEGILLSLGNILYESLGEEYPEVLGAIIGALKEVVSAVGMTKMTPPIKDLLPRLTPILRNRHEKVQENVIELVGRIADKGASFVSAKEWMRICIDLIELLKAHKKSIRRATVCTFGYIAKAIGPQDVMVTLLNNLKTQERQIRVCTTVAIAIVSETCGPFTTIPSLYNEYRVMDMHVQNGVLKALSFMLEYVGEMAKDYIYSLLPLLEDALTDRDLVHRQTACTVVRHLALNTAGLNCEDALEHCLNFVFPNIFETSPHVIGAVLESLEALRVGLGSGVLMQYLLQGLFHPARRVRDIYWKIYNQIYVSGADSMVPFFPEIPEAEGNKYDRSELNLMI